MKNVWCVAIAFGTLLFALPAAAQLQIAVEADQVVVRDVAAGGRVAIIGVVQEFPGDTMHVRTPFLVVEDEDRDGEVSLEETRLTRSHSVRAGFVAVELSSGRNTIGLSHGTRLNVGRAARVVMTDERNPRPSAVSVRGRVVSALLVRPGVGAWRRIVQDGASADGDGRGDGKIFLEPASFAHRTAESPPPAEFLEGDIVAVINSYTRAINIVEIGGSKSMPSNEG